MTRPLPSYVPTRRVLKKCDVLARLGWSPGKFKSKRPELEAAGFPMFDELLDGWDAPAMDRWHDERAGLAAENNGHDPLMEALNDCQA